MSWSGKESGRGVAIAAASETWGTGQTFVAGDGILVNSDDMPFGEPAHNVDEVTNEGWPAYVDMGNIPQLDTPMVLHPRFNSQNVLDPYGEMIMALFFGDGATGCQVITPTGGTNARKHVGKWAVAAGGQALDNVINRWFTVGRYETQQTGYTTWCMPSWKPGSIEIVSKAGEPVQVTIGGIGNKVEREPTYKTVATTTSLVDTMTYLDRLRKMWHYHLSKDTTNGGCWLAKQTNADSGAQTANFDRTNARVQPSEITIKMDRKHEAIFTTEQSADEPEDNGFTECTVDLVFPHHTDTLEDSATKGIVSTLKAWESDTEGFFHFRARWSFGTVIEAALHPYFEFGAAKLRPVSVERVVEAGKITGLKASFQGLRPTAITAFPDVFRYAGMTAVEATAAGYTPVTHALRDTCYMAIQNILQTAYLAT